MLLTARESEARERVLEVLAEQKVESYVAYADAGDGPWHHIGECDRVVPQPDLVTAWIKPGCRVSYHHAHPDDRALSPSDLRTLYNPGLENIWAHCPSGIFYRANLAANVSTERFEIDHEHLNGFISEEMARDFVEASLGVGTLPSEAYRNLSERAFCDALHQHGSIRFDAYRTDGLTLSPPADPAYMWLVVLSRAILDRRWPLPPAA